MSDGMESEPIEEVGSQAALSPQELEQRMREYQQRSPDLYYSHSGRPGLAAPLILIIGLPLIAALAAVYSYIVVYCPVVGYVNVLFTGGFIIAMGFVINWLGRFGKCRSPGLMALMGLACGVFALYFSWLFFIKALFGNQGEVISVLDLILNPIGVVNTMIAINNNGWWAPSGVVQWILSGIESVLIVGGPAMITAGAIDREVFCEDCKKWCEPTDKMSLNPTPEMLALGIDNVESEHFLKLDDATEVDYPRLDAEVLKCQGCQSLQGIRFELVTQEMDDGELKEKRGELSSVLIQRS